MSEVKRFTGDLMYGKPVESRDGVFVYATDFDAQRLRADTAEAELAKANDKIDKAWRRSHELDDKACIPGAFDAWKRPVPQFLPYDFSGNPGTNATQYCNGWNDCGGYWKAHATEVIEKLAAAEQRIAEIQKQLDSIDNHLRGNVNDPDPLPPIMPGAVSYTTTYGLVAGLRRERDYLKKTATPLPAGDDYLRQLAQRLREYVGNPHHIDPLSESFKRLIDDSAFALSKLAALNPNPEAESHE